MPIKYMPYQSDFLSTINELKCVAIIVAMESEEASMTEGDEYQTISIGKKTKYSVKKLELSERTLLVVRSGVGLVNAGILLTLLCEYYPVDGVILLGAGGALDERLKIGDVVIAQQIIQHDSVSSYEKETVLLAPGELSISAPPDRQVDPVMRCDGILAEWLYGIFKQRQGEDSAFMGTVLSGSEFVANSARKTKLREVHEEAMLVEMEAAALAQVSRKLGIPIGVAKTVVDRLYPDETVSDEYKRCLHFAAQHAKTVFEELKGAL